MKKAERVDIHIRVPVTLHAQLGESATQNHQSLNAEIVWRLKQSLLGGYRK